MPSPRAHRRALASADRVLPCVHWNQPALRCDFWPLGILLAVRQGLPCDLLRRKQTQALTK